MPPKPKPKPKPKGKIMKKKVRITSKLPKVRTVDLSRPVADTNVLLKQAVNRRSYPVERQPLVQARPYDISMPALELNKARAEARVQQAQLAQLSAQQMQQQTQQQQVATAQQTSVQANPTQQIVINTVREKIREAKDLQKQLESSSSAEETLRIRRELQKTDRYANALEDYTDLDAILGQSSVFVEQQFRPFITSFLENPFSVNVSTLSKVVEQVNNLYKTIERETESTGLAKKYLASAMRDYPTKGGLQILTSEELIAG